MEAIKKGINIYDIIHLHEYRSYISIVVNYYAKKYAIPYVLQAHGQLPRIIAWRRLKWVYDVFFGYRLLKDASKVIALSRVEAEQYKAMGVPEEKITVIPNGIDLSEYANLPPKGCFKRKFGIPEEKKIILYLGRIHRIKGIDILLRAYAHLKNRMGVEDSVLVIAGPDNGFLDEVKSLTGSLGISDSVLFIGSLFGRDKLEAFVDSKVYVLPSRYEIWGMTVLEAYACGKPVIASRVGGLKDLVLNNETGLLFEARDFRQLAESIYCLLNDEGKALKMGLKARELIYENFSIERVVDKLEKLYGEIVS